MNGDTPAPADGDVLSDALEAIRLRGAVFFQWQPSWPYATTVPEGSRFAATVMPGADQVASYHIVTEGPCWGAVAGEEPVRLESGDILLLPRGDAYVISSRPQQPSTAYEAQAQAQAFFRMMAAGELPPLVIDGGGGPERNRLVCGFLGCDMRPFNPVLGSLPRMLRLPAAADDDSLATLIGFAMNETRQAHGGRRCYLLRLSELMFVEVIRRYLRTQPHGAGWLQALHDPVAGRALALMHAQVARAWTLQSLARAVGTSRTTLASRFADVVGDPPMQYLARWRMQVAARALSDSHRKVYAVAQDVGYESEAAFSRAFKRIVGVTPARWRKQRAAPSAGQ